MCKWDNLIFPYVNVSTSIDIKVGDPSREWPNGSLFKCRGGHYAFPLIALLYPRYVPYNSEF